jgi:uncharacterized repeat protein (TIGR01451 family)
MALFRSATLKFIWLVLLAGMTADETDPNPGDDSVTVSSVVNPTPADLAVTMTGSSDPVAQGDDLSYTIVVTTDAHLASGVVVKDTLPSGVNFVSASAGASETGGVVTYPIGVMLGNNTRTLVIIVRSTTAGPITNTAAVMGNEPDRDPSNNTATLTTTVDPSASGPSISAPTTNPNEQVVPQRGGAGGTTQSFSLTFSEAPEPSRAINLRNYHLFAIGRTGVVGSSRGRMLGLRSATYDSSTHTVTLVPKKALASGLSFKIVVDGTSAHGVSDPTGRLIDGNGDGQPGGDYVVVFARGKALSYRDRDGDVVSIKLRGGGVLELSQRADGTIEQLRVVGAVPGRSVLSGRVVRSGNGNGSTTLGRIAGLGGVKNLLKSPRFIVG